MTATSTNDSRSIRARGFIYPLGLWVVMAVVAVINGGLREMILIPRIGADAGHVLSTGILIAVILVLTYSYFTRTTITYTRGELLLVGVIWVILTVGFEFLIGYIAGIPVSEIIAQYDVFAGHVWIFVPLTLLVAPFFVDSYVAK